MKRLSKNFFINKFFRTYPREFTIKDFIQFMELTGAGISKEEARELLDTSPCVFASGKKTFVTRCAAFSYGIFSFMPTKEEIEKGSFVPGDRLIPFGDFETYSFDFDFVYNNKKLKHRTVEFSREFALDNFSLFGEEYEVQYIASDPAMADYVLSEMDFELPPVVKLTAVDFAQIIKDTDFSYGDRFECTITDWDKGVVKITPVIRKEKLKVSRSDIGRKQWDKDFEKALVNVLNELGPCASIDQQLAYAFLSEPKKLLSGDCGSVKEYLSKSKVVAAECFGVETRLWFKGNDVPAFGPWNEDDEIKEIFCKPQNLSFTLPDFILDEYIKDFLFEHRHDFEELINTAFPKTFYIPFEERQELLLHIVSRNDIIKKNYNLFADYGVGEIRHKALELYSKVSEIVYNIDRNCAGFENYPQQDLVILIQLYTHTAKMLESIAFEPKYVKEESGTMLASLEGMVYHFEEIAPNLRNAILLNKKDDFTVI